MPKNASSLGLWALPFSILLALAACRDGGKRTAESPPATAQPAPAPAAAPADPHSFSRPDQVAVKHLDLDLTVDFAKKVLSGRATLALDNSKGASQLVLDTRDLDVAKVTLDSGADAQFSLGDEVPFLGKPLRIAITPQTQGVTVEYSTRPQAAAVQWLEPAQTAGKKRPFLFTQSEAILARTWVPCQDTPAVRMTYAATIHAPKDLMAVMSAENPQQRDPDGVYKFKMDHPIPSYLLALAVGDLEFRSLGARTGVYAEPSVAEKAAWELADTEKMVAAAEQLYGPYRWGRYDLLILPPSFPFGGMENPRLTFATPTILAGDRSLVNLVAHELAHSWSGNLVTNATWNDFWLNEGFTTYFENRISEAVYGREYSEMLAALGRQELEGTIADLGAQSKDTHLRLDLAGRDPDEGTGSIAYEKGYVFLRTIEEAVGRPAWDAFLRSYFDEHAFQSMTTDQFLAILREKLLSQHPGAEEKIQIAAWVDGPGLPQNAPVIHAESLDKVEAQLAAWKAGKSAKELDTQGWASQQWVFFLNGLPSPVAADRLADLDAAFHLNSSGNSEILFAWLMQAVKSSYAQAYPTLERFLTEVGRRKFVRPLFTALAATPEGTELAKKIYAKARPGYHSVTAGSVDQILHWQG
jgi:leukotriene-A4 hydrolase